MNVLSLFSGIGGLDLGLERAGMTVVGQVEIDPWCRTILAKHWPEVPRHDDVRTAVEWWLAPLADSAGERTPATEQPGQLCGAQQGRLDGATRNAASPRRRPAVDVVAGGFPCQPVSLAGKGLAQADSRWLWPAFAGVIRQLRPRYAVMENVPGLLGRGLGDVVGDLAAIGYDAEWDCVPAAFVGAPHIRNRVFIVAYPASHLRRASGNDRPVSPDRSGSPLADADCPGRAQQRRPEPARTEHAAAQRRSDVADPEGQRSELRAPQGERPRRPASSGHVFPDPHREPLGRTPEPRRERGHWPAEPDVGRVAHGIPRRVDRLRGLGNAVVPAVAEHIGRLIMEASAA